MLLGLGILTLSVYATAHYKGAVKTRFRHRALLPVRQKRSVTPSVTPARRYSRISTRGGGIGCEILCRPLPINMGQLLGSLLDGSRPIGLHDPAVAAPQLTARNDR